MGVRALQRNARTTLISMINTDTKANTNTTLTSTPSMSYIHAIQPRSLAPHESAAYPGGSWGGAGWGCPGSLSTSNQTVLRLHSDPSKSKERSRTWDKRSTSDQQNTLPTCTEEAAAAAGVELQQEWSCNTYRQSRHRIPWGRGGHQRGHTGVTTSTIPIQGLQTNT